MRTPRKNIPHEEEHWTYTNDINFTASTFKGRVEREGGYHSQTWGLCGDIMSLFKWFPLRSWMWDLCSMREFITGLSLIVSNWSWLNFYWWWCKEASHVTTKTRMFFQVQNLINLNRKKLFIPKTLASSVCCPIMGSSLKW